MSLIRQIGLLLLGVVMLALAGAFGVTVMSMRDALQTQLRLKNNDNAQALALALSQQKGDAELMQLLMSAQFDTGFYRSILLKRPDGRIAFERRSESAPQMAPEWFSRLLPIESQPGTALVSDGWSSLGSLEVVSHVAYAYDELWRSALRHTLWMLGVGLVAALAAYATVRRIRRPLDATVEQANALVEGRYVTVAEPKVPELRRLARAMNGMVQRMRALFEAHAAQLEALRRQAHCDPLTGLSHRAHFMERLGAALQREDRVLGGLVLVRLADLARLNRDIGHEATDRALQLIAKALQAYTDKIGDCFAGRLNGSDFALCLPAGGLTAETAQALANGLRAALQGIGPQLQVHLGAVEVNPERGPAEVLAAADLALARAEAQGPFAVEFIAADGDAMAASGERGWRTRLAEALGAGRTKLVDFPVLDRQGRLVHLESPLRVQMEPGGDFLPAARWLPLASRSRLTASTDAHAIGLALQAIARDGLPRGVNVSPSSLADGGFAAQARRLVEDDARIASLLWLEVDEAAALVHFDTLQALGRLLRPLGIRFGLEHAGQRLHRIERLYELGLDYVKLDGALCRGVAKSEASRDFVRSSVALLHALSIAVHAEGVESPEDAEALWDCGVDGITGPWASSRYGTAG
jgi:diguanylate cyclase (GGDEF)-like protein